MKKIISSFNIAKLFIVIFIFMTTINPGYAQRTKSSQNAGEQRKAEKGLKDNKYFLYFIDPSVTNFGGDEEKKIRENPYAYVSDIIKKVFGYAKNNL